MRSRHRPMTSNLEFRPVIPQPLFRSCSRRFVAEFRQYFILAHELLFEARNIVEETLSRQPQKIETELRVLEIKLFDLLVAGSQNFTVFHALDGLGSPIIGRKKAQVSENLPGR